MEGDSMIQIRERAWVATAAVIRYVAAESGGLDYVSLTDGTQERVEEPYRMTAMVRLGIATIKMGERNEPTA